MYRLITLLLLATSVAFGQVQDNTNREIIIAPVSVISMERNVAIPNQAVIVKNGLITYVGDAKKAKPSDDAIQIDGTNKYIMPGLAEMHAHVPPNGDIDQAKDVLALFLANGVTTIRGMLGHPNHLVLRSKINSGEILGPHFYTTGPSFNGQSVKTTQRAAEMVREQKAAGYDYLKLHPGLTRETFPVVAATAKEVGIPFVGHVSFSVGVWRAIDAKYSSIDHMDGFVEAITPGVDTLAEQQTGLFGAWIADRADASKIPNLVSKLAAAKIWVVPTQSLAERWQSAEPASVYLSAPEMKYMKPEELAAWKNSKDSYLSNPNFSPAKAKALVDIRREMLRQCRKGGVGLLLGSDAPQIFNVPGFSVHHELKYLVDAGLTPFEALKTGTVNVATYLGKKNSGLVKVGFVSDLILLNGNPLQDIRQSSSVDGVMIGTKWLPKTYLDSELKRLVR